MREDQAVDEQKQTEILRRLDLDWTVTSNSVLSAFEGKAPFVQEIRFDLKNDQMTLRLIAENEWTRAYTEDLKRGRKLITEQVWHAGMPWWRSARKTIGDQEFISGKLLVK